MIQKLALSLNYMTPCFSDIDFSVFILLQISLSSFFLKIWYKYPLSILMNRCTCKCIEALILKCMYYHIIAILSSSTQFLHSWCLCLSMAQMP